MYEKLIGELHIVASGVQSKRRRELLEKAADAIEELSTYVQHLEELREDGWYLQKTKMMTYGQATMTAPLPEPPKEERE